MRDKRPILVCTEDAAFRDLLGYLALSLALPLTVTDPAAAPGALARHTGGGILVQLPAGAALAPPWPLPSATSVLALVAPPGAEKTELPLNLAGVDYIMADPMAEWELRALLPALAAGQRPLAGIGGDSYLQELAQGYLATIPAKLLELSGLLRTWQQSRQPATMTQFIRECHKLAGSAGSYGYPEATELCRLLEGRLNHWLAAGMDDDLRLRTDLALFPRQLRLAFMRLSTW